MVLSVIAPTSKLAPLYIRQQKRKNLTEKGEEMIEITMIFMVLAAGYAINVLINDYQYKRKWRKKYERDT